MPKKYNRTQLQNYVPAGNGDASGEYADEETGSNIHFTNFQKPDSDKQKKLKEFEESILQDLTEQELKTIHENIQAKKEEKKAQFEDIDSDLTLEEEVKEDTKLDDLDDKDYLPTFEEMVNESLDESETKNAILSLSPDLDKEKVSKLDEKSAKKLLKAIETEENAEKKQNKLFQKYNKQEYDGIWKDKQTVASLAEKFGNGEQVLNSLEEKLAWAKSNKPELAETINNIDKEDLANQVNSYIAKKDKLNKELSKAQKLLSEYEDPNNIYSQKRKDNAVWCKNIQESKQKFPAIETKNISGVEKTALMKYTSSYSAINEPLRNIKYSNYNPAKKEAFIKDVKHMTSAIDKSVIDFDFWTQRGTSAINFPGKKITWSSSEAELQDLVGTKFEDQAFVSTGAAKNTGFASHDIILNIYCPKGTKGAYVDNISHFSGENELILQRGYSYKVTKVEKKGGKIYLDCDLILGSDSNKYTDEQLEEIKEKYFM